MRDNGQAASKNGTGRDFRFYLEVARRLPWEFEQYPSYELHGVAVSGEEIRGEWAAAARKNSFGGGLGVYCHVPFCASRCLYCHCFSGVARRRGEIREHLESLSIEMGLWEPVFRGAIFTSAYVGGGTPTLLSPQELDFLLGRLRRAFRFAPDAQWTVEATPRSASPQRLAALRDHAVGRLSLGVQSFDAEVLARADRTWQSRRMVERACRAARDAGFPIVNGDLMAGLAGQSVESFLADARALVEMGFDTIHVYAFEPDGPSREADGSRDDSWRRRRREMLAGVGPLLSRLGYRALFGETVYARRAGVENRYDFERYRQAGSVLGLGWRAYSHVFPGVNYIHLSQETWRESLRAGRLPPAKAHRSGLDGEMREFLVLLLRTGVDVDAFRRLFGRSPQEAFPDVFAALRRAGRLIEASGRVTAKAESRLEYLALTLHFFPDDAIKRLLLPRR